MTEYTHKYYCPKCRNTRNLLIAKIGINGSRYWQCSNYPICKTNFSDNDGEPNIHYVNKAVNEAFKKIVKG